MHCRGTLVWRDDGSARRNDKLKTFTSACVFGRFMKNGELLLRCCIRRGERYHVYTWRIIPIRVYDRVFNNKTNCPKSEIDYSRLFIFLALYTLLAPPSRRFFPVFISGHVWVAVHRLIYNTNTMAPRLFLL